MDVTTLGTKSITMKKPVTRTRVPSSQSTGSRVPSSQSTSSQLAGPLQPPKNNAKGGSLVASERAASADIQLLQLHLLHRASHVTTNEWREDAKKFYQQQFNSLGKEESEVGGRERGLQMQKNATALIRWSKNTGTEKANGDVKTLSKLVYELQHDLSAGGSYTRVIQGFDDWYARSTGIQRIRSVSESYSSFVEGIGDGWRAEVATLATRATSALNRLRVMGDVVEGESDLKRLLDLLSELLLTRLHELEVIQAVASQVCRQESAWMHKQVDRIDADVSNEIMDSNPGVIGRPMDE